MFRFEIIRNKFALIYALNIIDSFCLECKPINEPLMIYNFCLNINHEKISHDLSENSIGPFS